MPWNHTCLLEQRRRFVRLAQRRREPFARLCRRFGISRAVGYKLWGRFVREGEAGLPPRSRRPCSGVSACAVRWRRRVLTLRRRRPTWGARKLRWLLRQNYPRARLPAERTLGRWLRQAGLVARRARRAQPGPRLPRRRRLLARRPHDVWTIDFKGRGRAGDGAALAPLTVRDLASRQVLAVRLLAAPSERAVRAVLTRLFRRHGLPRALWADNGAPFACGGPLGLSHLSAWWQRLGVRAEFSRRGCPQDNAAHEQMHRVLKAETMQPSAATAATQQRRYDRWRRDYNRCRPHEALGMGVPAARDRPSPRRLPAALPPLCYPARWSVVQVGRNGRASWRGRVRLFGRAFAGERLGLRPRPGGWHEVYFGAALVGTLYPADRAGLRPAQRVAPQFRGGGGATPPPSTHPSLL